MTPHHGTSIHTLLVILCIVYAAVFAFFLLAWLRRVTTARTDRRRAARRAQTSVAVVRGLGSQLLADETHLRRGGAR